MRRRSKLRGEQGTALVETALSSVVMLAMLLGMFELFLALYSYHYVSYAAREASRYAIVRGADCVNMPDCAASGSQVQTYVRDLNFPGINANNLSVTTTWYLASQSSTSPPTTTWSQCPSTSSLCNAPGNAVQVAVTYAFPLNLPFVSNSTINLHSTSQLVISQ